MKPDLSVDSSLPLQDWLYAKIVDGRTRYKSERVTAFEEVLALLLARENAAREQFFNDRVILA